MVDATLEAARQSPLSPMAAVSKLRATVSSWPWRLFWLVYGFNLLTSLPFLLDRSSNTSSAWWSFPIDDSWIHLNYVHGLATEACFCYNSGISEAGTTSWGWVLFLTPFYLVGHLWMGLDPVIVVKFVGIGLGAITTLLVYYLAFRVTSSKPASLVIAAMVSVEPTWVFLRLSGMEGVLVTPLVLGSTVALLNRKWAASGLLLAAAFWARPEVGFYVGAAAAAGAIYWFFNWPQRSILSLAVQSLFAEKPIEELRRQGIGGSTARRLLQGTSPVFYLLGFPALALIIWSVYNLSVNGHVFPNTYLAKNDSTLGLFPLDNITIVWHRGVGDFQSWADGWRVAVAVPLALVGAAAIFWRERVLSIGLVLFTPLLIYGVASGIRFGDAGFNFFARRYIDPSIPVFLMVTLIGGWVAIKWLRGRVLGRVGPFSGRLVILAPIYIGLLFFLFVSAKGQFDVHDKLTEDFSWNTRNIYDEDELAGLWLKRHAPAGSSVMIADAGAIRYFSDILTLDAVGLNSHENIGRPAMQIAIESKPDFIAIWEDGVWDSMPNATKVARFDTPRNTILGGGPVGIYALDWSKDFVEVDVPVTAGEGLEVLDSLDLADRESEIAHSQTISFVSFSPEALGEIDGVNIRARGVSHDGTVQESFQMVTTAGNDIDLVLRYRSDALPGLTEPAARVRVNGFDLGLMPLDAPLGVMAEATLRIPSRLIPENEVRIDVAWEGFVTEFQWWTVDVGESGTTDGGASNGGASTGAPLVNAGPPEGAIAFDGFAAPEGAPADLRVPDTIRHGGWWIETGDEGDFTFRDGRLVEESLDDSLDHFLITDAGISDVSVQADLEWTGSSAGLVIRHDGTGSDNLVFAWYSGGDVNRIHLAKIVNGTFTLVAQIDRNWGPLNTIRHMDLSATGPEVLVWVDGVNVIRANVPELADNTYAGVFARGETVTAWDNFSLVPTGEPPE